MLAQGAALKEPGEVINGKLVVQPGSALVGTVFPLVGSDEKDAGSAALVLVQADPVEVWDLYAKAVGLGGVGSARDACAVSREQVPRSGAVATDPRVHLARFLSEPRIPGENRMVCGVARGSTVLRMVVGASLCTQPSTEGTAPPADASGCDRRSQGHLWVVVADEASSTDARVRLATAELSFNRGVKGDVPSVGDVPQPPPAGPVVQPVLELAGSSRLPGPGEPIDDGLDPYLAPFDGQLGVDRVPDGAQSLVAPSMPIECNSGLVAVLKVSAEPAAAVAVFDRASTRDDAMTKGRGRRGGTEWAAGQISTAGGYYLGVTAVPDGEHASTVLVTECGD